MSYYNNYGYINNEQTSSWTNSIKYCDNNNNNHNLGNVGYNQDYYTDNGSPKVTGVCPVGYGASGPFSSKDDR